MTKRAIGLVVAALVASSSLAAQQEGRMIRGTVTDSLGRRLPFTNIMTTAQSKYAADSAGDFGMRAPDKGEISLRFYRIGYEPRMVTFDPSGDTTIAVTLTVIPRVLEAMEIEATRTSKRLEARGFYDRMNDRKKGVGSATFFTIDDIQIRNPLMISEMLRDVPGVRIAAGFRGSAHEGFEITGPSGCKYSIYVDGSRIAPTTTQMHAETQGRSLMPAPQRRPPAADIGTDAIVTPSSTAGIEVYPRGVGAPPQYPKVGSTCGVVLFWSR